MKTIKFRAWFKPLKRMNIKKISNWIFIIGMLFLIAGMICQVVGL
jgi:uncharacterized membrane protein